MSGVTEPSLSHPNRRDAGVTDAGKHHRMAGFRALAAVGRSITSLLNTEFATAIPAGRRPTAVLAGTSDFDSVNSSPSAVIRFPSVAVYCYRITVDKETRPGWSSVASTDGQPRIPLQMHLSLIHI